ncbi:class F sortase [Streptomyces thermoalcalitolerans]
MASPLPPQTPQHETGSARRRRRLRLLLPAAMVGLGLVLIHQSVDNSMTPLRYPPPAAVASHRPAPAAPAAPPAPTASTSAGASSTDAADTDADGTDDGALPRSEPTRISIPDIAVDAPFTKLSLDKDGHLAPPPPDDTNLVGWFQDGASPGERGSAIVVGHLDTKTGPAVFAGLNQLQPGDPVDIERADGTVVRFKVDSVEMFSKADFPDDLVYADAPTPELRLITCGGTYDHKNRDYRANVVVFAHLDSSSSS